MRGGFPPALPVFPSSPSRRAGGAPGEAGGCRFPGAIWWPRGEVSPRAPGHGRAPAPGGSAARVAARGGQGNRLAMGTKMHLILVSTRCPCSLALSLPTALTSVPFPAQGQNWVSQRKQWFEKCSCSDRLQDCLCAYPTLEKLALSPDINISLQRSLGGGDLAPVSDIFLFARWYLQYLCSFQVKACCAQLAKQSVSVSADVLEEYIRQWAVSS